MTLEEEARKLAAKLDAAEAARVHDVTSALSDLAVAAREFADLAQRNAIPTVRLSNFAVRESKSWRGKSIQEPTQTAVADGWSAGGQWCSAYGMIVVSTDGRLFTQPDEIYAERRTDFFEITAANTSKPDSSIQRPDIERAHGNIRRAAAAIIRGTYVNQLW